jgi:hypothetical protein
LVGLSARFTKVEEPTIVVKNIVKDERADRLKIFLKKYNSPLADYSREFIFASERFNIEYKTLVAIAGQESHFATAHLCGNNNPFGYGNPCWNFPSFREAIWQTAKTIGSSKLYRTYQKSRSIRDLAGIYNQADTENWIKSVSYFREQIR